jgi:hypothetical protein
MVYSTWFNLRKYQFREKDINDLAVLVNLELAYLTA